MSEKQDPPKASEPPSKPGWYYATAISIGAMITTVAITSMVLGTDAPVYVYFVLSAIAIGGPEVLKYLRG